MIPPGGEQHRSDITVGNLVLTAIKSCDSPLGKSALARKMKGLLMRTMATALSQAEIYVALVVAAHAAILALRLCVSLYRA